MAKTLCEIWKALAEEPTGKAAAEARARVRELLEHVDDCEACCGVSEQAASPELIFGALAGDDAPLSKDERELRDRLKAVLASEANQIDTAVDALLSNMTEGPGTLDEIAPDLTSAQLVSGVNAVNMLVRRHAARDRGKAIELTKSGLRLGATVVANRAALVTEIAEAAEVTKDAARGILDWQLLAAESVERLYRGLLVESSEPGTLRLTVHHDHADEPLATRWVRSETELELDVDFLPKPVREYVEEIADLDAVMVPALDEAAAYYRTAGKPEIGKVLGDQSREVAVERKALFGILGGFKEKIVVGVAAAAARRAAAKPKYGMPYKRLMGARPAGARKGGFFIEVDEKKFDIFDYAKKAEEKKTDYFAKIAASTYHGKFDIKPLKKHASYCLDRSQRRIKRFDNLV